jgi:TetR/AcrR family transcriptional regulator
MTAVRRHDSEASRAAILDAAEDLFLDKGFAGTSMSDIAKASGVTKSLIHHHFGSKEGLWSEVKRASFAKYHELQMALFANTGEPVELLRASMRTYFQVLREHPATLRMIWWMVLEGDTECDDMVDELCRVGVERIEQAQAAGLIRDDVGAQHILTMFLGLVRAFFSDPTNRHEPSDADADGYIEAAWTVFSSGVIRSR